MLRKSFALVFALAVGLGMVLFLGLRTEKVMAVTHKVKPTPWFTMIFGHVFMPDGSLVPEGTVVQAITPRGEVAGQQVVMAPDLLPFMFAYGEDPDATPPISGFRKGEQIVVSVGDFYTQTIFAWKNDWDIHMVILGHVSDVATVKATGDEGQWGPRITLSGTVTTERDGVWISTQDISGEIVPIGYVAQQGNVEVPITAVFDGGVSGIRFPYPSLKFDWGTEYCFQIWAGNNTFEPDFNELLGEVCVTTPQARAKVQVLQNYPQEGWTLLTAGPAAGLRPIEMFVLCGETYTKIDISFASSYPIPPGPFCRYAFVDIKIDEIEIIGEGRDLDLTQVADATILFEWSRVFLPMVVNH